MISYLNRKFSKMKLYFFLFLSFIMINTPLLSQNNEEFFLRKKKTIQAVGNHQTVNRSDLLDVYNVYADDFLDSLKWLAVNIIQAGIEKNDKFYLNIGKSFLATYFNAKQNTSLSIQLSRSALKYFEGITDFEMMIFAYNQIGNSFVRERNMREAHLAYEKALSYAEYTSNYTMNIYPLKNSAEAYYREKEYKKAIEISDFLIKNIDHKIQYSSLCHAYLMKAKCYLALNKNKEAEKYLNRAYEVEKNYPSTHFKSSLLTDLAMFYYESDPTRAKALFDEALLVSYETTEPEPIAFSLFNLGMWFYAEDQADSSLFYFNELLSFSKENFYEQGILDAYGAMSDVYEEQGKFKEAFQLLSEYREVTEEMYFINKQKEKDEIIETYDLLSQEADLVFAEGSQSIFERIYKSERRVKIVTLLAIGIALSFMLFYFIRTREERKTSMDNEYL